MNRDFDYVYFTNTSSYVRLKALKAFCDDLGKVDIHADPVLTIGGIEFISGSSRLLSRGLLKKILLNTDIFSLWKYEDVEFGKVAALNDIELVHFISTEVILLSDLR